MADASDSESSRIGVAAVVFGASLWATSGTIIKHLTQDYGVPPLTVAAIRVVLAGSLLFVALLALNRKLLYLKLRDVPFFLLFGFLGVALTQICWVLAISQIEVGVATALNYTAPAWTVLLAWPLLREGIDRRRVAALLLTVAGVALIVRIFDAQFVSVNSVGLLLALVSGLGYALYNIFGRSATMSYPSWTAVTYAFLAGAAFLMLTQTAAEIRAAVSQPEALMWLCVLALVPTLGGYAMYTFGLRYLKASVASILATVEPVIAVVIAAVFLGERLNWLRDRGRRSDHRRGADPTDPPVARARGCERDRAKDGQLTSALVGLPSAAGWSDARQPSVLIHLEIVDVQRPPVDALGAELDAQGDILLSAPVDAPRVPDDRVPRLGRQVLRIAGDPRAVCDAVQLGPDAGGRRPRAGQVDLRQPDAAGGRDALLGADGRIVGPADAGGIHLKGLRATVDNTRRFRQAVRLTRAACQSPPLPSLSKSRSTRFAPRCSRMESAPRSG